VVYCFESGNEREVSMNGEDFLDELVASSFRKGTALHVSSEKQLI
jgi:hypothetical protein